MSRHWVERRVDSLVTIRHGFAFEGAHFSTDPSLPTLVTPGNFRIGGGFTEAKPKTYAGVYPEEYVLEPGALVVTMTDLSKAGDTLGYSARIPPGHTYLHNQRIGRVIVTDAENCDEGFLYYLFQTTKYRSQVLASATGSTVRHTSPGRIGEFKFSCPPLDEQRRIAGVLGALDDLIDTNEQLKRALSDLQHSLYSKAASAATFSVEFGELAELVKVRAGESPNMPYLGLEHFAEEGRGIASVGKLSDTVSQQYAFDTGDVLYGRLRPYFRKVDRPGFSGACSGEIWVLKPREGIPSSFLHSVVASQGFTDFAMAGSGGTHMPRARWDHVSSFQLSLPNDKHLARFDAIAEALWEQSVALTNEVDDLRRTRDELLPLLLSGKVRVLADESDEQRDQRGAA